MMNHQSLYHFIHTGEAGTDFNAAELAQLTRTYPWFEGAHILEALYKNKYEKEGFEAAFHKASIYIYDPLWLQWQALKMTTDMTSRPDESGVTTAAASSHSASVIEPVLAGETMLQQQTTDDILSFEPLHAIDYFASQGIRLQQDQLGNDHFSQQVKTFTQWLKSMKKIYHSEQASVPVKQEGVIEEMAEASNRNEEIVTETMAEVLISQGKKRQAHAIYEKLSLLYPEKSSYFAARISQLND